MPRPRRDKSVRVIVELLTGRIGRSLEGCFGTFGQALATAWLLHADGTDRITFAFLVHPPAAGGVAAQAVFFEAPAYGGDSADRYATRIIDRLEIMHGPYILPAGLGAPPTRRKPPEGTVRTPAPAEAPKQPRTSGGGR
jgi:hypothetical protein